MLEALEIIKAGKRTVGLFCFESRLKYLVYVMFRSVVFAELMILGFISLLLTFGQNYMARICIPHELGDTFLPCKLDPGGEMKEHHRRLLCEGRMLAADSAATSCKKVCGFQFLLNFLLYFVMTESRRIRFSLSKFLFGRDMCLLYLSMVCTSSTSSFSFWQYSMSFTVI